MFRQSDGRVVERVLAGHREEYATLVERYWGLVYSLSYAHAGNAEDARDLAQEALVSAFQKLDALRERNKFGPWLAVITRNLASKLLARRRREAKARLALPPNRIEPDLEAREMRELVRTELMRMEEGPREVLVLHYFSGMSTREIARALEIGAAAAEKRLQRARKQLGDALLEHLREPEEARLDQDRRKGLMGLVLTAPTAWEPAAAAGVGGLSALLHAARLHIVLPVLGVLVAGTGVFTWQLTARERAAEEAAAGAVAEAAAAEDVPAVKPTLISDLPSPPDQQQEMLGPRTIKGYTLDYAQRPVAGATVTLLSDGPEDLPPWNVQTVATTKSEADGGFVFENISGESLSVVAWTEGTIGFSWVADVEHEKNTYVPMLPAASLSGRVVDTEGRPVAGVVVAPAQNEGDGKYYPHTRGGEGELARLPRSFSLPTLPRPTITPIICLTATPCPTKKAGSAWAGGPRKPWLSPGRKASTRAWPSSPTCGRARHAAALWFGCRNCRA